MFLIVLLLTRGMLQELYPPPYGGRRACVNDPEDWRIALHEMLQSPVTLGGVRIASLAQANLKYPARSRHGVAKPPWELCRLGPVVSPASYSEGGVILLLWEFDIYGRR
jgi:hypothetical protein